jgi:glycerophosphoryl diester phosphodiesterase
MRQALRPNSPVVDLVTLVVAHRGASARYPENTVDAFRGARELGADWVELDVRRTADGRLAVHHDAHLPDGRAIVELDADDLPASVPDLTTALDACRPLGVNVEIKNLPGDPDFDAACAIVDPVAAVLDGRAQSILVSSFHAPTLDRVREAAPSVATALLTFTLTDAARTVDNAVGAGHVALHPFDATVDATLVALCHERGLAINVWTVDDPGRIAELAALGVDGIVTNVPDIARDVLQEQGAG